MKKLIFALMACLTAGCIHAENILFEGFEYANHDMTVPIGWTCPDQSWLCGYLDKDHNRKAHTGNWYAFTDAEESWMFMPLFMSSELKYRYHCWVISDGSYDLEFWAGNQASPNQMSQLLFSVTVNSGNYQNISEYVETIQSNFDYFGIRAVASQGAYRLSIDDIEVDMVNKYDMEVTPFEKDTVMYPGTVATYDYVVQNTGFEDLQIYMTPYEGDFIDVHFMANGLPNSNFPTVPDEIVSVTATATLHPDAIPGNRYWLDIMFTVSCDCVTRMATLWTNVLGTVETFPLEAHFDDQSYKPSGWVVMGDDPFRWQWVSADEVNSCIPYGDSEGMFRFSASKSNGSSLLISPKLDLNPTDNLLRLHFYRTSEDPDKNDRINIYYNTELSLEGATLLETIHRCTTLSPVTAMEGWDEYNLNFDCANHVGFLIFEAVGDFGQDLYLDEILIDNTPLSVPDMATSLRIFPNPANDHVTIQAEGLKKVEITDLMGKQLLDAVADHDELYLDLQQLPSGIYFATIITSSGKATEKIVK